MNTEHTQAGDATNETVPTPERNWRTMGIVELACENQSISDYIEHWEGRALKAEYAKRILLEALIVALPFLSEDEVPSLAAKQLAKTAIRKAQGE